MKCECCAGPAVGTIVDGVAYYHCEAECDGFSQLELFGGTILAVKAREGREAEAGRAVPSNQTSRSARIPSFYQS